MTNTLERSITAKMPTNDLFQTSTGVGHHWRPGYYYPDSTFKAKIYDPLPSVLSRANEWLPEDNFKSTNSIYHDGKQPFGPTQNLESHKRAPGVSRVYYLKDFMESIPNRKWRRSLSPVNQKSETHDEFDAKSGLSEPDTWLHVQPFNLRNHHIDGPSKKIIASGENPKLKGRQMFPKDQDVLRHLDPYMTTYDKFHRQFNPEEWAGIAKKDIPTYWDTEGYSKSWGFGPKESHNLKSTITRNQSPMRDERLFKHPTFIRQFPTNGNTLPHRGMMTEYDDSFIKPSSVNAKEANICPIDYPSLLPDPNPVTKYAISKMYQTEYESYGNEYPMLLS